MEIVKCLVLSTGHLPENELSTLAYMRNFKSLADSDVFGFRATDHEYGTFVTLSNLDEGEKDMTEVGFPSLWKIIQFCKENNIRYIDFDQDGPIEKEFEQFDW